MLSDEEYGAASRVLRGGCFYYVARLCRSAFRFGPSPGRRSLYLGFRPIITLGLSYGFTVKRMLIDLGMTNAK